jgi:hypothetical protein
MFTRQHYTAIAKMIKETTDVYEHPHLVHFEAMDTEVFVNRLIEYFSNDNPRFDAKRFLVACGLAQ